MNKKTRKLLAATALSTGAVLTAGCPLPLPGVAGGAYDFDASMKTDAADTKAADDAPDGGQKNDAGADTALTTDGRGAGS
jgi:hypothetical protein